VSHPAAQSQPFVTCACGKKGYTSKHRAKRAAAIVYAGRRMRAYRCQTDPRWWHLTSQSTEITTRMRDHYAKTTE
jgi:hypothetical protein